MSIRKIKRKLYRHLPTRSIFHNPSMASLAKYIEFQLPNIVIAESIPAIGYKAIVVRDDETAAYPYYSHGLRSMEDILDDRADNISYARLLLQEYILRALRIHGSTTKETDCLIRPPGNYSIFTPDGQNIVVYVNKNIPPEGLFYNGVDIAIDGKKITIGIY